MVDVFIRSIFFPLFFDVLFIASSFRRVCMSSCLVTENGVTDVSQYGDRGLVFENYGYLLTHCGRVTQICVFNTVKLGTSASSPQCHSTRGNVSRGITPTSTTRVFGEYFLKISVHKNSQRICYKFLKKHSIKVD